MVTDKRSNNAFALVFAVAGLLAMTGCDPVSEMRESVPAYTTVRGSDRAPAPAPSRDSSATPARVVAPVAMPTDSTITDRVKAGLEADPALSDTDVSVNTDHGVVHLAGLVKTQEQAAIATTHAQRQDGVMRVDSHLAVAPQ